MSLSRQPGNHKTRGIPSFVPFDEEWQLNWFNLICSWKHTKLVPQKLIRVFDLMLSNTSSERCRWWSLIDGVRSRKSLWSLPSFANGMDSMASAHWWTCLVMFSLFLNRPPHPFFSQCLEVAETYISLSVFLIVVFLYGFSFSSLFFFFFTCTKHTIDPTSIQTNKSTRTRTRAPQTLYFRFTFSKDLHTSVVMLCDFYFSRSTHFLFIKLIYKRYFTILQVAAENWKKAYIIFHFCTVLYNTITLNTVL